VLKLLLDQKDRIVTIMGEPGIGKSSMIKEICNYISNRSSE